MKTRRTASEKTIRLHFFSLFPPIQKYFYNHQFQIYVLQPSYWLSFSHFTGDTMLISQGILQRA
ncbi:hypothetical protein HanPI659440_Chr15g0583961 [Helianthus annuus]|nr:hypothetical protein HanPI659440_Chr15g0583961 [Helianthus annuus]